MDHFFITGTSKGIGKAIAETLLSDPDNRVTGLSRSSSISHTNYRHIFLDLSSSEILMKECERIFSVPEYAGRVVLINNAATIGEAGYIGEVTNRNISDTLQVNITSAAILMNEFIRSYKHLKTEKIIINISSGAGKRAVDGWGIYCASKAAMDMLSEVTAAEEKIRNRGFRIFSVAPGIADTEMQQNIRNSQPENFSAVEKFRKYKKEKELSEPSAVAAKYIYLIKNPQLFSQTVFSVRDF